MVQFANAALGPPVYMAKPNNTGRPETKFIVMYVADQFSKSPRWRKNSGNELSVHFLPPQNYSFKVRHTLFVTQLCEVLLVLGQHHRLPGRDVPIGGRLHLRLQLLVIHG